MRRLLKPFALLLMLSSMLLYTSCKKEKATSVVYRQIQLPTELNLRDINIINTDTIWVAAGNRFSRGAILLSTDGGQNWQLKLDSETEIRSFTFRKEQIYLSPIGNTIQSSNDDAQSWNTLITLGWEYFTACDYWNDSLGIVVGGENFGRGIIYRVRLSPSPSLLKADTTQHELTDIHIIDDSTCIAIGYGVILRSTDKGLTWIPDKTRGDFYQAMHFVDTKVGYVVGDYGSIHKTTDGGISWKGIKNGNTVFNTKNRLRKVFFEDAEHGAIVGNKGLCWLTKNGGKSWTPIDGLPTLDFSALFIHNQQVYIGTEKGVLISFDF